MQEANAGGRTGKLISPLIHLFNKIHRILGLLHSGGLEHVCWVNETAFQHAYASTLLILCVCVNVTVIEQTNEISLVAAKKSQNCQEAFKRQFSKAATSLIPESHLHRQLLSELTQLDDTSLISVHLSAILETVCPFLSIEDMGSSNLVVNLLITQAFKHIWSATTDMLVDISTTPMTSADLVLSSPALFADVFTAVYPNLQPCLFYPSQNQCARELTLNSGENTLANVDSRVYALHDCFDEGARINPTLRRKERQLWSKREQLLKQKYGDQLAKLCHNMQSVQDQQVNELQQIADQILSAINEHKTPPLAIVVAHNATTAETPKPLPPPVQSFAPQIINLPPRVSTYNDFNKFTPTYPLVPTPDNTLVLIPSPAPINQPLIKYFQQDQFPQILQDAAAEDGDKSEITEVSQDLQQSSGTVPLTVKIRWTTSTSTKAATTLPPSTTTSTSTTSTPKKTAYRRRNGIPYANSYYEEAEEDEGEFDNEYSSYLNIGSTRTQAPTHKYPFSYAHSPYSTLIAGTTSTTSTSTTAPPSSRHVGTCPIDFDYELIRAREKERGMFVDEEREELERFLINNRRKDDPVALDPMDIPIPQRNIIAMINSEPSMTTTTPPSTESATVATSTTTSMTKTYSTTPHWSERETGILLPNYQRTSTTSTTTPKWTTPQVGSIKTGYRTSTSTPALTTTQQPDTSERTLSAQEEPVRYDPLGTVPVLQQLVSGRLTDLPWMPPLNSALKRRVARSFDEDRQEYLSRPERNSYRDDSLAAELLQPVVKLLGQGKNESQNSTGLFTRARYEALRRLEEDGELSGQSASTCERQGMIKLWEEFRWSVFDSAMIESPATRTARRAIKAVKSSCQMSNQVNAPRLHKRLVQSHPIWEREAKDCYAGSANLWLSVQRFLERVESGVPCNPLEIIPPTTESTRMIVTSSSIYQDYTGLNSTCVFEGYQRILADLDTDYTISTEMVDKLGSALLLQCSFDQSDNDGMKILEDAIRTRESEFRKKINTVIIRGGESDLNTVTSDMAVLLAYVPLREDIDAFLRTCLYEGNCTPRRIITNVIKLVSEYKPCISNPEWNLALIELVERTLYKMARITHNVVLTDAVYALKQESSDLEGLSSRLANRASRAGINPIPKPKLSVHPRPGYVMDFLDIGSANAAPELFSTLESRRGDANHRKLLEEYTEIYGDWFDAWGNPVSTPSQDGETGLTIPDLIWDLPVTDET